MAENDEQRDHCPHLGVKQDSDSWFSFPSDDNYCFKPSIPQPVNLDYQSDTCLAQEYTACPVFEAENWNGPLPSSICPVLHSGLSVWQRNGLIILAIVLPFLVGFTLIQIVGQPLGLSISQIFGSTVKQRPVPIIQTNTSVVTSSSLVTAAPTSPLTQNPVPTETSQPASSPIPTLTVTPSITPTPTITPDYYATATLAFGTNLRQGPGLYYSVIEFFEVGTQLEILWRDYNGFWVLVRISDGQQEGWIFVPQLEEDLNISEIPVLEGIPTPAPSSTPAG